MAVPLTKLYALGNDFTDGAKLARKKPEFGCNMVSAKQSFTLRDFVAETLKLTGDQKLSHRAGNQRTSSALDSSGK